MKNHPHKIPVAAYIGLGSNLDNPIGQVRTAMTELGSIARTRVMKQSSLYRSPALLSAENPRPQPDYINAVVAVETELAAGALLDQMLLIERSHGRHRGLRWAARTLDLDLLVYGDAQLDGPALTVPHPGLPKRAFVLYPLHEIAPDLEVPGHGAVALLKDRCQAETIQRIES
ncbi:MAG TPA: 2-amino-4-hydroxy-6-hydroxymethyldihydropteridine diphosphokinase [Gammaproteobacteria bacterium]|nr:2-amino-4-hydroxy-6-hydroxymethyldihydropteridine diphosphokinase [Gammaproteobacteria bacterium]